ncbi:MAG TPA: DUF1992 domain-containing protein [Candidatus Limnocylindrales bacterium]
MSPIRRDGAGSVQVGRSWESLAERQIREAHEAGAFENLPYRGERLPLEGREDEHWLAHNLLKQNRIAPAWIEADRDVRTLLERRAAVLGRAVRSRTEFARRRDRAELKSIVETANRAIFRLNYEAPTDRQHRTPLDLEAELGRLAGAHESAISGQARDQRAI